MKDYSVVFTNTTGAFPAILGRDITVPGDGLGTEWIAEFVNDHWGARQHLMTQAGLTPNAVTEVNGNSQDFVASQRCFGHPGEIVSWGGQGDPSASGIRLLKLDGTVLTASSYTDLVTATYIGDGNNSVSNFIGFFKTSDAGGTTRDTAGPYFVLPNLEGFFIRGNDPTAIKDPDGASRGIPYAQASAFETHGHELLTLSGNNYAEPTNLTSTGVQGLTLSASAGADRLQALDSITAIVGGNPNNSETRPHNVNFTWCVRY
jgi:hypothetical protein